MAGSVNKVILIGNLGRDAITGDAGDDTRRGAALADGEGGKDPCDAGDDKMERTIFVGGVPLAEDGRLINPKTIKTFFRDCGEIESVRLRSLPVENPALPKKASELSTFSRVQA